MVAKAVAHNTQNKSVEKTPSIAKKRAELDKNLQVPKLLVHLSSTEYKKFAIQSMTDLMKIVDCLLDEYGSIDNNFVTFKLKK